MSDKAAVCPPAGDISRPGGAGHGQRRRRGALRPTLVPHSVLRELEEDLAPSVNHMEQMAVDMGNLLGHAFPELLAHGDRLRVPRFLDRLRAGGVLLREHYGAGAAELAMRSSSDTVRGWGACASIRPEMRTDEAIEAVLPFADDPHFAVREWAWLAARPSVAADPLGAVDVLVPLTGSPSARVRRFSAEVCRPRGVWSPHIPLFKRQPEAADELLDRLVPDQERYVRLSVGNWLNDAARTQPAWVVDRCSRWSAQHGAAVAFVCARGLRSVTAVPPASWHPHEFLETP